MALQDGGADKSFVIGNFEMSIFSSNKTIAAIATGQAAGGIGIVRISGEDALAVADRVFTARSGCRLAESKGYRAHYGFAADQNGWQDESVAIVYRAPHSYTGEDVVELCCHGGLTATRLTLAACLAAGAQPASAGEFTRRAFENGKLSLTQAEAVMQIISAEGRQAALAAQAAHGGSLARRVESVSSDLTTLAGKLAAWCDFPDEEEIPAVTAEELDEGLSAAEGELSRLVSEGEKGRMLQGGIDAVICGKPNVGKSTLMNLLAGCEKSIVTDIPGTTRDVVEERITLGDCILRLSDTAGIHDTDDAIENIGVDRARRRLESCALVLAVFDGSRPLDADDISLIEAVSGKPCVAIINKSDREQIIDSGYICSRVAHTVSISAAENTGVEALERAVLEVTRLDRLDPAAGILINDRQIDCARQALAAVREALGGVRMGVTFDAVNVSITDAIEALMELSGVRVSDRVVDEVFSHFCLGK